MHRTWIKRLVNVPLRAVQAPFTNRPWFLVSVFIGDQWTGRYSWARVRIFEYWE